MKTYLAVPISAKTIETAAQQMETAATAGAEMLEVRLDYLQRLNELAGRQMVAAARQTGLPVVATCRDERQGGANPYPNQLRLEVLAAALEAGADFIDYEYDNFCQPASRQCILEALSRRPSARLILSAHNFEGRFTDAATLMSDIHAAHPTAVAKLAYQAGHINDCFEAFDLLHKTGGERIVLAMGQAGTITRILAKKLGGFVAYASLAAESATAPGQLTIEELKGLYRYDVVDGDTELFGVIGWPVAHSLSPAIHNAAFEQLRLNNLYLPLGVQPDDGAFSRFLDNALSRNWLDFRGFSITIPHKQSALEYVASRGGYVEPLAGRIGAVNTIVVGADGVLKAYNTDYAGALNAITGALGVERTALKGLSTAVVGAGGVARAVVAGLTDAGARVKIYNRTVERAHRLAEEFGCEFAPLAELKNIRARLLINCTSVGMHPQTQATPVPPEALNKDMVVFDTVYNPVETLLIKNARRRGGRTIDGLAMFVNQAAAQFHLFTGKQPDTEAMMSTARGLLQVNM